MHQPAHHTPTGQSAQVIPLHCSFAMRTYQLDLPWQSGARFVGRMRALTRDEAEDLASAHMGETPDTLVRSSTRPLPLASDFTDTLPTLDMSSALADMANALRRSEAVAEDLVPPRQDAPAGPLTRMARSLQQLRAPAGCDGAGCRQGRDMDACDCGLIGRWCTTSDPLAWVHIDPPQGATQDPGPGPSGADFDAYNALYQVHGPAVSQPATTAARLAPLRRAHTASSVLDDMRLPLRRRDLWIADASVALAIAAVLLLRG